MQVIQMNADKFTWREGDLVPLKKPTKKKKKAKKRCRSSRRRNELL